MLASILPGISVQDIRIVVRSGSVVVETFVRATTTDVATSLKSVINSQNTTSLSDALNITVSSIGNATDTSTQFTLPPPSPPPSPPPPSINSPSSPPSSPPASDNGAITVIAIALAVVGLTGLGGAGFVAYRARAAAPKSESPTADESKQTDPLLVAQSQASIAPSLARCRI
jgi:hypothetical protein